MSSHQQFMQRCLQLASLGLGKVAPNPMVGALLVHNGKIIGEGYHHRFGESHAEVNAIADALKSHPESILSDATLYVSLEPCSHHGKTPPCCDLIIQKKIRQVVIAHQDPFAQVNGEGIQLLKKNGIDVITGICEKEARELNRRFICFHAEHRPYVILKFAQSRDGFISPKHHDLNTRWITNTTSRKLVHKWRSEEMAIMVGTKTALLDNPELTVRDWQGDNPIRIVIDRSLKLPSYLHLFNGQVKTLIINEKKSEQHGLNEFICLNFQEAVIPQILNVLHKQTIQSIIVEGGMQLLQKFIDASAWDEARIFTGNKWLGDGIPAPKISGSITERIKIEDDQLIILKKNHNSVGSI